MKHLVLALMFFVVAAPARADLFTVGAGGTHTTIQGAIDAALARGGSNEIRVATGTWRERLKVLPAATTTTLRLSGGWLPGFSRWLGDPELTVIDGEGQAPVVHVDLWSGSFSMRRFTVTGGDVASDASGGGGLRIGLSGDASMELNGCLISENHLTAPGTVYGGGLVANVRDSSAVTLRSNRFEHNSTTGTGSNQASTAGADLWVSGRSRAVLAGNVFVDNQVFSSTLTHAAALDLAVQGESRAELTENAFVGNGTGSPESTVEWVVGSVDGYAGRPVLVARRNAFRDNGSGIQLALTVLGEARFEVTDGLFTGGAGNGVRADARDTAEVHLTNLTVTGHNNIGVDTNAEGGSVFLSNSIVFGNNTELVGTPTQSANLVGVDPYFLDPTRDYRLAIGSPGIDAGDGSPPAGLGPQDILGAARVQGVSVDIGAFEAAGGSSSGPDQPCRILLPLIVDQSTGACICGSDFVLRALRCSFFGPEITAVFETPLDWKVGAPVEVTWTLHPWTPVAGPYAMDAALRINNKWSSQTWLGPTAQGLQQGVLVVEPFKLQPPSEGRSWLRTRLEYLPVGQQVPTVLQFEALLPDPAIQ